jgi:hypothetical protein
MLIGGDRYALRQLAVAPVALFLKLGGGLVLLAANALRRAVCRCR